MAVAIGSPAVGVASTVFHDRLGADHRRGVGMGHSTSRRRVPAAAMHVLWSHGTAPHASRHELSVVEVDVNTRTETIIHQSRRFTVTLSDVRSANDVYTLEAVSHARVRHPYFIITATAVTGLTGAVGVWWDHLFDSERLAFICVCASALFLSSRVARVQLMSVHLRNDTYIYGPSAEIRALKVGIERALVLRARASVARSIPNLPPPA